MNLPQEGQHARGGVGGGWNRLPGKSVINLFFFLFLDENICCEHLKEQSQGNGSF